MCFLLFFGSKISVSDQRICMRHHVCPSRHLDDDFWRGNNGMGQSFGVQNWRTKHNMISLSDNTLTKHRCSSINNNNMSSAAGNDNEPFTS